MFLHPEVTGTTAERRINGRALDCSTPLPLYPRNGGVPTCAMSSQTDKQMQRYNLSLHLCCWLSKLSEGLLNRTMRPEMITLIIRKQFFYVTDVRVIKTNSQRILVCNWGSQKVPHRGARSTQKNSCWKDNRCPVYLGKQFSNYKMCNHFGPIVCRDALGVWDCPRALLAIVTSEPYARHIWKHPHAHQNPGLIPNAAGSCCSDWEFAKGGGKTYRAILGGNVL